MHLISLHPSEESVEGNHNPSVVVVISSDDGYLAALQEMNHKPCMIYSTGNVTKDTVLDSPWVKLKWVEDVLSKDPFVDPVDLDLPYYGREHNFKATTTLISLHPSEESVAVAVGNALKIFNMKDNNSVTLESPCKESIRAIWFGPSGKLFACASDDKVIKIWSAESWMLLHNITISGSGLVVVAIKSNDSHICFADKQGDLYVVDLAGIKKGVKEVKIHDDSRTITSLVRFKFFK